METTQTSTTDDVYGQPHRDGPHALEYRSVISNQSRNRPDSGFIAAALLLGVIVGAFIGIPLISISFFAGGMGHGSYFILLLSSSPLCVAGDISLAFFGIPIVWGFLAALAATAVHRAGAGMFVFAMCCHYIVNLFYLHQTLSDFGRSGFVIEWIGLTFYAAGNATLWIIFAWACRRQKQIANASRIVSRHFFSVASVPPR
jgi:hypothetical protein